jgi:mono/diheme cytochrome c family protein
VFLVRPAAAQTDWRTRVSAEAKSRANPLAGQAAAAAAGAQLYAAHCAKCHGDDANGRAGRPGLRTDRVAGETDGELFWILQNGARWQGMPAWSSLGDTALWQLVVSLRAQRPAAPAAP